jgi:3-deoxy-D-manno-octulosonate 8-phosphate phosphatase (KDO 8-P phosphatase)
LKSRYKGEVFQTFLEESGLEAHQVLYMGDDVPDLIPMQLCGLSVAPANARTEALQQAQWRTQLKGGEGCVREVIEYVMRKQNTWEQTDPTW